MRHTLYFSLILVISIITISCHDVSVNYVPIPKVYVMGDGVMSDDISLGDPDSDGINEYVCNGGGDDWRIDASGGLKDKGIVRWGKLRITFYDDLEGDNLSSSYTVDASEASEHWDASGTVRVKNFPISHSGWLFWTEDEPDGFSVYQEFFYTVCRSSGCKNPSSSSFILELKCNP